MKNASTKRSVLSMAVAASFLTPFVASATNVALPAMQEEFHLDAIMLAWIPTSYLLSAAVFLVPLGKVADIYGRRETFVWGIWTFTVSSILTAASVTTSTLLLRRVLQGIGSAMMFATGIATLVFSVYLGRAAITPDTYSLFLKSLATAFIIFALLCVAGIFASLARGKMRPDAF